MRASLQRAGLVASGVGQCGHVEFGPVRQPVHFQVAPRIFYRVEVGGVGGQKKACRSGRVGIERNLEILPRSDWNITQVRPGDRFEIVHFVGGG